VLAGLVQQGGVICGLDFYAGGHLTHGAIMKGGKKLSASSNFFTSKPYHVSINSFLKFII
jgi:glycine/serine hydroxymethyltransferase